MVLHTIDKTLTYGTALSDADKVLILLHGRGATAGDIAGVAGHLNIDKAHIIAPQATNYTWYPYSFMAPVKDNEPWLSSAVELIYSIVKQVTDTGMKSENIFIIGFSQGACLALEFAARHAMMYGGVVSFTGGLIGAELNYETFKGNFAGTKIFIGNSDKDPHVPLHRSQQSKIVLEEMGANVTLKVYPGMGHTISQDEIETVNEIFFTGKL